MFLVTITTFFFSSFQGFSYTFVFYPSKFFFCTDLVKIHLGDHVDSKLLLGSYVCTEVPGEFKWQPGALTQVLVAWLMCLYLCTALLNYVILYLYVQTSISKLVILIEISQSVKTASKIFSTCQYIPRLLISLSCHPKGRRRGKVGCNRGHRPVTNRCIALARTPSWR